MRIAASDFELDDGSERAPLESLVTTDQITLCTVRLDCSVPGRRSQIGTGFFYEFATEAGPSVVIISNEHVVRDAKHVSFHVCAADQDGHPLKGLHHEIPIEN